MNFKCLCFLRKAPVCGKLIFALNHRASLYWKYKSMHYELPTPVSGVTVLTCDVGASCHHQPSGASHVACHPLCSCSWLQEHSPDSHWPFSMGPIMDTWHRSNPKRSLQPQMGLPQLTCKLTGEKGWLLPTTKFWGSSLCIMIMARAKEHTCSLKGTQNERLITNRKNTNNTYKDKRLMS